MRRFRTLALAVATTALVLSAFGAPATAAFGKGSIAVVNGRPGPRLDFCIGNAKIRRNIPYGSKAFRQLTMGDKVLRAYLANGKARCSGVKVAQYPFSLLDGGDLTLVVTRKNPNVVAYDNAGLGSVQQTGPLIAVTVVIHRTAADLAGVNVLTRSWSPNPEVPVTPTVNPVWTKGDHAHFFGVSNGIEWQARATFPENPKSIAVARRQELINGRRHEWILVGSHGKNARWVKLSRAVYAIGP